MSRVVVNPFRVESPDWSENETRAFAAEDVRRFHRSLPGYSPTPLLSLPGLAAKLGLKKLLVKDESQRLGLKAFKVLGASYAIFRFLKEQWETAAGSSFGPELFHSDHYRERLGRFHFCTATDGNHGRAVAWTAGQIGEKATVFMPEGTVAARIKAIESEGAEVVVVDGDYDRAVREAQQAALASGWQVISDTSYPGYMVIPNWIMAGYVTMFGEIDEALGTGADDIDAVVVQAGVGSLAATAAGYCNSRRAGHKPRLISVEPEGADCLAESIRCADGGIHQSVGMQDSMMAGLNCATPSLLAWPFVRQGFDAFVTIPDHYAAEAMRRYYHPLPHDPQIVSGESGAAGLGALLALLREPELQAAARELSLGESATVLVLNTEGDTDPENFERVVGVAGGNVR